MASVRALECTTKGARAIVSRTTQCSWVWSRARIETRPLTSVHSVVSEWVMLSERRNWTSLILHSIVSGLNHTLIVYTFGFFLPAAYSLNESYKVRDWIMQVAPWLNRHFNIWSYMLCDRFVRKHLISSLRSGMAVWLVSYCLKKISNLWIHTDVDEFHICMPSRCCTHLETRCLIQFIRRSFYLHVIMIYSCRCAHLDSFIWSILMCFEMNEWPNEYVMIWRSTVLSDCFIYRYLELMSYTSGFLYPCIFFYLCRWAHLG